MFRAYLRLLRLWFSWKRLLWCVKGLRQEAKDYFIIRYYLSLSQCMLGIWVCVVRGQLLVFSVIFYSLSIIKIIKKIHFSAICL